MKMLKEEYKNCKIQVKNQFNQLRTVDTSQHDLEDIAKIPCFDFLFEEADQDPVKKATKRKPQKTEEPKKEVEETEKEQKNFDDYSLSDLRKMFPDIKATSKKKFIEQIV